MAISETELLRAKTYIELEERHKRYEACLPPEYKTWLIGAIYVRESGVGSLMRDAPGMQFDGSAELMTKENIFVPWAGVYFDNVSGGSKEGRHGLLRLLDAVERRQYCAVAALRPNRLFRNAHQRRDVENTFLARGVRLLYASRPPLDMQNPREWREAQMEGVNDEGYIRDAGKVVADHLHWMAKEGKPLGHLPEGYEIDEREPPHLGRLGKILTWKPNPVLAPVLIAAKDLYLSGDYTHEQLAAWSIGQLPGGLTPRGVRMDQAWWKNTLGNPKYAGYQAIFPYRGFNTGKKGGPKRPRRTPDSELSLTKLPPLWSLDEYHRIRAHAAAKRAGYKRREGYKTSILSGIAYDARCYDEAAGHRSMMYIRHSDSEGPRTMICREYSPSFHAPSSIFIRTVEREFDEVIARIRLDDEEILRMAEEELRALSEQRGYHEEVFLENPRIAKLRAVLELLGTEKSPARASAEKELADVLAADARRRESISIPVLEFQVALDQLREWEDVWRDATQERKNELLRAAKVKVFIEPMGRTAAVVTRVECEHPAFALALSLALPSAWDSDAPQVWSNSIPAFEVFGASGDFRSVLASLEAQDAWSRPEVAPARFLSVLEYSEATGLDVGRVRRDIKAGRIVAHRPEGNPRWHLISEDELERVPVWRNRRWSTRSVPLDQACVPGALLERDLAA